jgi:hypothetical protein
VRISSLQAHDKRGNRIAVRLTSSSWAGYGILQIRLLRPQLKR